MPKKSKVATSKPIVKRASKPGVLVISHPTMCLHCHLIVEMTHEHGADKEKGAWACPLCGHKYLFAHWKIKTKGIRNPVQE